jgi:hypothetical protein
LAWAVLDFADPRAGSIWPPIFQTMHISPLTTDFVSLLSTYAEPLGCSLHGLFFYKTNTTGVSFPVASAANDAVDQQTESPDMFMRHDTYCETS